VQRHAELLARLLGLLARVLSVATRHPEPLARGAELAFQGVAPVREFLALARRGVAVDLQPPRLLAQLARLPIELLEPLPGGGDRAARLVLGGDAFRELLGRVGHGGAGLPVLGRGARALLGGARA
jgi:hypothetical protein